MKASDIAKYGLMLALALVLSYVEALIPFVFPVPGMKVGLANIVILTMLYIAGPKEAAVISFLRLILVMFTFGNAASFIYSLAGAVLSFAVMCIMKKTDKFGTVGVSVAGGIMHNVGQIIAAVFMLDTGLIMYYLPWLVVAGLVSGIVIGIIGGIMSKKLSRWMKISQK